MAKEGAAFWVAALPFVLVLFGPIAYAVAEFGPAVGPLLALASEVPINLTFFSYVMAQITAPLWVSILLFGSLAHLVLPALMLAYVTTGRMREVYRVSRLRGIVTSPVYLEHLKVQVLVSLGLLVLLPLSFILGVLGLGIYLLVVLYAGAVSAALWGRAGWAIDHGHSGGTVELFTSTESAASQGSGTESESTEAATEESTSESSSQAADGESDVFDRHDEQWHIPDSDTYEYAVAEPDDGYRYYKTKRGARDALERWYD